MARSVKEKPAVLPAAMAMARTFEGVCDSIRAAMAAGQLKPGDKLPPEREMAAQFQVGRNAVREALRTLEMAGVVRLEKGRAGGAYICPANARRVTVAMRDLLDFGSISLDEITESRTMMMDMVTRLACERLTSADLEVLEANVNETEAATNAGLLDRRAELIAAFYAYLAGISGNRVLVVMTTALSEIVRRFLDSAVMRGRPLESLVPSRRRFLVHLRARDADNASAELRQHLITTHKVIQRAMERVAIFPGAEAAPETATEAQTAAKAAGKIATKMAGKTAANTASQAGKRPRAVA